ncbi:MAG: AraC family transcriptional regulator [Verrucomicrobiae bacterium]|nr:AraC family transcriptional regulator [Verrucomicrobiae bacterium]
MAAFRSISPSSSDLEDFLCAQEKTLGITLTIHDCASAFQDAQGRGLFSALRASHRHPYCREGRRCHEDWDRQCFRDCYWECHAQALRRRGPFAKTCWKGAVELVVPMMRQDVLLAVLFAGVFCPGKDGSNAVPPRGMARLHSDLPQLDESHAMFLGQVLVGVGQALVQRLEQIQRLDDQTGDRQTLIRRFIHYHAHQDIGLADLAKLLHLSPSRASHLIRELLGASFQDLLIQERLRRVRGLLVSSRFTLQEIAERTGFANAFYLSRLFKAKTGVPPNAYRCRHQRLPMGDSS